MTTAPRPLPWRRAARWRACWFAWSLACLGLAALPAGAATDKIVVDEFLLRCADGRPDGAFVELVAAGAGQTFDAALGVRLLGPSGGTVSDLPGVFASRAGQPWPQGQHFLIATALFEPLTGVTPDTVFASPPTSARGSIVIYRKVGTGTAIQVVKRVDYSSSTSLALTPPPGRSAFSVIPGLYHWSPEPSPTRSDGVMARAPGCFADPHRPIRITELATQCGGGDPAGGFIEISPTADNQALDSDLALRALDHSGAPLFDVPPGFGLREGSAWPTNRAWLAGDTLLKSAFGDGPDLVLPFTLDPVGGRLVLHGLDATGAEVVLSELEYGTAALPAPPGGASLVWDAFTGRYVQRSPSTPTDFTGRAHQSLVCVTPSSLRIRELLTSCAADSVRNSYIELIATAGDEMRDSTLALEIRGASDSVTALVTPAFGSRAGTPWLANTSWLFATGGITNDLHTHADALLPALDPVAGRVDVLRTVGGRTEVIQSLRWGGTQVAPPPGQALRRFTDSDYRLVTTPQALASNGQALGCPGVAPPPGPPPPPPPPSPPTAPDAVRLSAVMLACSDGGTGSQFVQVDRTSDLASRPPDLRVRLLDRAGNTVGERGNLFPSGGPYWGRNSLVIGGPDFQITFGLAPDALLPAALDTVGGTIQLVRASSGVDRVLSELHYGPGGVAAPTPATALVLDRDGCTRVTCTWRPDSLPHASGFNGDGVMSPLCGVPCALQRVRLGLNTAQFMTPTAAAYSDLYNDVRYDLPRAEFDVSSRNWRAELLLSDQYAIAGLAAPETLETFVDVLEMHADTCIRNICSRSTRRVHLIVNGELADSLPASANGRGRLLARVPFLPDRPTRIQVFAAASGFLLQDLLGRVVGRLGFERPAGGARMISCGAYDFDRARVVHEAEWSSSPHSVAIDWRVSADPGFTADVERLDESDPLGTWRPRETRPVESSGFIRFRDTKTEALNTYRYRLAWSDKFGSYTSDEIRISTPRLPSFGLVGAIPNPSRGSLRASFELAEASEVRLELFDLLGRRVREVRATLGAGTQEVAMDQGRRLAPGLYQLRLGAGGYRAKLTVVVLP